VGTYAAWKCVTRPELIAKKSPCPTNCSALVPAIPAATRASFALLTLPTKRNGKFAFKSELNTSDDGD